AWPINTAGRERVASLSDLKPAPPQAGPFPPGATVSDLTFQTRDFQAWSLARALAKPPARPLALLLYRTRPPEPPQAPASHARPARPVLRDLQLGKSAPGEPAAMPLDFSSAAAMVLELGQFTQARWDHEQQQWESASPPRSPGSADPPDE